MSLLLIAGCGAYVLSFGDPGWGAFDEGLDPVSTTPTGPDEPCNGADDDADGVVDEGFPDSDADGRADCVDPLCTGVNPPPPEPLEAREDCAGTYVPEIPVDAPFSLEAAWDRTWAPTDPVTFGGAPLVAWLDDDDGDGVAGPGDGPEIVLPTWGGNGINVLDGASGAVIRTLPVMTAPYLAPAIGDADGDGFPEIFSVAPGGQVFAVDREGAQRWRTDLAVTGTFQPSVVFTDLEGDGVPELVVDDLVIDAASGAVRFRLSLPYPSFWRSVVAVDLDLDGAAEILSQGIAFDATGRVRWDVGAVGDTTWAVPVQADDDPEGEVAWVGDALVVCDTDGSVLVRVALAATETPGAPVVADLDGDGDMDLALPSYPYGGIQAFSLDGTELWKVAGPVRSVAPGLTAFDFAGDGSYELLYPAEDGLQVLDGATGETVAEWELGQHLASFELATVADVDEDGHADVITGAYAVSGSRLVRLRHGGGGWPPAGSRWTQVEFSPELIGDDARVVVDPDPPWACPGGWRAWPAVDARCGEPDLVVEIGEVCVEHCEVGPVTVALRVGNRGTADARAAEVDLTAWIDDVAFPLATLPMGGVPAGGWMAGLPVVLPPDAWGATAFSAEIRAVDEPECDVDNNTTWWDEACATAP